MNTEANGEKPKRKRKAKQEQIPGTERKDINDLIEAAAEKYVEVRDERMALTKKEVEARTKIHMLMKEHSLTIYRTQDGTMEIAIEGGEEKVKVRKIAPVDLDEPEED